MTDRVVEYSFVAVDACDMCGANPARFIMLGMRLNRSQGFRPRAMSGIAVSVKQCQDCGLIFADPQPIPANLTDHYDAPEDYWGEDYFAYEAGYFSNEIREAKSLLNFVPGMRALDIGAGAGKAMKALTASGFDVWGIEPIPSFRDLALRNGVPEDRLRLAGIEDAEFDADTFDFITFGAVLEHLRSPSAALENALSWLRPGGIIQAEVPSSRHLMAKITNAFFRLRGTNYVTHISPMHVPFHLYEFGLESFVRHGELANHSIALSRYSVCEILHLPRFLHKPLRWLMERTDTGMQLTVYLRKRGPVCA